MTVTLHKTIRRYPLRQRRRLQAIARAAAELSGLAERCRDWPGASLPIQLTDDAGITPCNEQFLQHEGPTDVISFDFLADLDSQEIDPDEEVEVGQLVISMETAVANAAAFGHSPSEELVLYIVHGMLHLCGYDDHKSADIRRMRAAEARVMAALRERFPSLEVF